MSALAGNEGLNRWMPYPKYKDSGVEWLGEVPEHWKVKRLKFVADINPSKSELNAIDRKIFVSFVPMEFVGFGDLSLEMDRVLEDIYQGFTYFKNGDVLIAKITPSFENGKGAIAKGLTNGIGFGTTELHTLRPNALSCSGYLYYLSMSHVFRVMGAVYMRGTAGQKRVEDYFVINFPSPLPPRSEQLAIAVFLDRETAKIDGLIAKKQRLVELLQEKRTVLISQAVTKGLDANAPMKDSGVEWLGGSPEGWEDRRLKTTLIGCTNGIWGDEPRGTVDDIVCIRVADFIRETSRVNIHDPTIRAISPSLRDGKLIKRGDLLLEKSGGGDLQPVGSVVLYDHDVPAVNSNFIALIKIALDHDPNYLCYLHHTLYSGRINTRSIKQTTGIQNLDQSYYLDEKVSIPPLGEQRAIAAFLDRETTKIDNLISKVQAAIHKLQEYRTALISAAVTGKMKITENK